jgi:hypothetical protein
MHPSKGEKLGEANIKMNLKEIGSEGWTGFI